MALTERSAKNTRYIKIIDYSLCERERTEQTGKGWEFLSTKDSSGTTYNNWIKRYSSVSGYITNIQYVSRTLPGTDTVVYSWEISMRDGKERYSLSIPKTSKAAGRFVKLAGNLQPEYPVEFSVWKDNKGAKPQLAFMVKQAGANVPQKYTLKDVEVGGKTVTALVDYNDTDYTKAPRLKISKSGEKNWTEIEEFLFERMEEVMEKFKKYANENFSDEEDSDDNNYTSEESDGHTDDEEIPF